MTSNFERTITIGLSIMTPILLLAVTIIAIIHVAAEFFLAILMVAAFIGVTWFVGWIFGGRNARK